MPPPSQRTLRSLAKRTNSKPLPPPRERAFGVKLPPEADCLTAANWQVKPSAAAQQREVLRQRQRQQQQQVPGAAAAAAAAAGGYGVRREQRIGMAVPGEGWQPPPAAAEAVAAGGPAAAAAAAADGGGPAPMQLDTWQQQQQRGAADMAFEEI